jgi:hypothetical protein
MLTTIVVGAVCLLAGFGVGRIKNASKLAAISADLKTVENDVIVDGKSLYAKIKAHL